MCHVQPWPIHYVSWPALTSPPSQLISLDLGIVHIWYIKGCVMLLYSQRSNNSPQAMEMHGNFHPHLQWKWVVREYYSHGLEYCLSPYSAYKVNIFIGGYMGHFALYLGSIARNLYRSSWPTFTYYLQGYPRRIIYNHSKALHQNIMLLFLIRSA